MDEEINNNRPKTAAVYVRVSTTRQDADNQLLQLRQYCDKAGYTIYKEYTDIISGGEESRPAFNQMFKDSHKLLFDVLVFWSLDRFSRSGIEFTVQKLQELKNLQIGWESYTEPYFRTVGPFGPALVGIMATLAKIEKDRISERTKAGLARRKAQGKRLGRPPGSKDSKKRRTKGYYDNKSAAKGKQKKEGSNNTPKSVIFDGVKHAENQANNRPFIECPSCGFNLRPYRSEGKEKLRCDKCFYIGEREDD
jgi:DNA invertase Pin-like site-specific DNA recombinase